jgi:hypothetical protein
MMLSLVALIVFAPAGARADEWNKATTLTFNHPVEVPGMVLGAGTYVFRLADSSDRNVVQILSADQSHVYENVLAIPAYRPNATDKTVVTFEERAKGSPDAISSWFYPGDNYGQEFVYPKAVYQVASLAPLSSTAPPTTSPKPAAPEQQFNKPVEHAAAAPMPKTAPVQISQNPAALKPASTPAPKTAPTPVQTQTVKTLPKTASPVPALVLIGLLSLAVSAGIRLFSKQSA